MAKEAILKWPIPLSYQYNNGPFANSGIQLPIPLIYVQKVDDSPKKRPLRLKKWPNWRNQQEESATSKWPLLAVQAVLAVLLHTLICFLNSL